MVKAAYFSKVTHYSYNTSMLRILRPATPLGILSDGWLPTRNDVCLCPGSNLDHNSSIKIFMSTNGKSFFYYEHDYSLYEKS